MELGEYIEQERMRQGLTVKAAAQRIGISVTRLQEVESGISRSTGKATAATTTTLVKIARGLDLPLPHMLALAGLTDTEVTAHEEAELLSLWHGLSPENRAMALTLLRAMRSHQATSQQPD